jgi:hypothetical protein
MLIYISGPITGKQNDNREAFEMAAQVIAARGHQFINPHHIGDALEGQPTWNDYMKADIKALVDSDAMVLLEDWEWSSGAQLEHFLAERLGITVFENLGAVPSVAGSREL